MNAMWLCGVFAVLTIVFLATADRQPSWRDRALDPRGSRQAALQTDVVQHVDRAVLVVPSSDLTEQRRDRATDAAVITGSDASSRVLEPT
jgi:hypothetical protein